MGHDKALLQYHGLPQREYVFALLQSYCERVFTSCRPGQHIPAELNPLDDMLAIKGPMNGILSAFRKHPECAWLVVAVDMPFVDARAVKALLAARDGTVPAVCFRNPENRLPEPLCTVWEPSAYRLLEDFVGRGEVSPRRFLVEYNALCIAPYDARVILNVNTPEERERLLGQ